MSHYYGDEWPCLRDMIHISVHLRWFSILPIVPNWTELWHLIWSVTAPSENRLRSINKIVFLQPISKPVLVRQVKLLSTQFPQDLMVSKKAKTCQIFNVPPRSQRFTGCQPRACGHDVCCVRPTQIRYHWKPVGLAISEDCHHDPVVAGTCRLEATSGQRHICLQPFTAFIFSFNHQRLILV